MQAARGYRCDPRAEGFGLPHNRVTLLGHWLACFSAGCLAGPGQPFRLRLTLAAVSLRRRRRRRCRRCCRKPHQTMLLRALKSNTDPLSIPLPPPPPATAPPGRAVTAYLLPRKAPAPALTPSSLSIQRWPSVCLPASLSLLRRWRCGCCWWRARQVLAPSTGTHKSSGLRMGLRQLRGW